jgi:hypothetical protein
MLRFQCICDHCGEVHDRGRPNQLSLAVSAREHAGRMGWRYTEEGEDICPRCAFSRHRRAVLGQPEPTGRLIG